MSTHAPTTTSTTAVDQFLAFIADPRGATSLWAEAVVVDAVVPGWRFAVRGPAAAAATYRSWFDHPTAVEELRRIPTTSGEVVEYTATWLEGGVPHAARHVHVVDLDDDGRIVSDHVWCGGRWPAHLLAQMDAAQKASGHAG